MGEVYYKACDLYAESGTPNVEKERHVVVEGKEELGKGEESGDGEGEEGQGDEEEEQGEEEWDGEASDINLSEFLVGRGKGGCEDDVVDGDESGKETEALKPTWGWDDVE